MNVKIQAMAYRWVMSDSKRAEQFLSSVVFGKGEKRTRGPNKPQPQEEAKGHKKEKAST